MLVQSRRRLILPVHSQTHFEHTSTAERRERRTQQGVGDTPTTPRLENRERADLSSSGDQMREQSSDDPIAVERDVPERGVMGPRDEPLRARFYVIPGV